MNEVGEDRKKFEKFLSISGNQRYTLIIAAIILVSSIAIIALNYYSIKFSSSIRAYVNGESQYSKAQKDATKYLINYLDIEDTKYYRLFEKELAVPIGDSLARIGMNKAHGYETIKQGFIQGRNHSDDVDNLIWLYSNFRSFPYFSEAVTEWRTADFNIRKLHEIGGYIYQKSSEKRIDKAEREKLLEQIEHINTNLTLHQQNFSNILSEASRTITAMLLYFNISFILLILISAGLYARNLIKQLVDSKNEAEKQSHAKDEFLSIASHELKTPITSMKASLQILERFARNSPDNNKLHPFIQNANKQVNRLTGLVNDLLDVTKIQRGKLVLNESVISVAELIRDAVEEVKSSSKHEYVIRDLPEVYVYAVRNRISQVVVNFLSNAAKYSPQADKIIISVTYDKDKIKVSVQDFGIGVQDNKIPLLFERFYRVEEDERIVQGLGLGLYICCEIIKNHRGQIGAESEVGKGSTFWFSLPAFAQPNK